MTRFKSADKQRGFADLRQQIADVACDRVTPANEMGQLPNETSQQVQRATLHLRDTGPSTQTPHTALA